MDSSSFITANYALSKILIRTNDQELRKGITKGWYIGAIQEALAELAFDTFYNIEVCDIYNWNENGEYKVSLPKGCFSVKELYLFNGSKGGEIEAYQPIDFKVRYDNRGHASHGFDGEIQSAGRNSGIDVMRPSIPISSGLLYGNIESGMVMLSESCDEWDNLRIKYYGVQFDVGETPCIPIYLEAAVEDYVVFNFFEAKMAEDPRFYSGLYDRAKIKLYGDGSWGQSVKSRGTWGVAKVRVNQLSDFEKRKLKEYYARANHLQE